MFRFLQEVEQRLRAAARYGRFKEVMGLLEQGINVDADDEVRHSMSCLFHAHITGGCVLWPKRYLQHPLPYMVSRPHIWVVREVNTFWPHPQVIRVCDY